MIDKRFLLACITVAFACLVAGSSIARNPLQSLSKVEHSIIHKHRQKINAFSTFDLEFRLSTSATPLKLRLEPNYDVIANDATVTFLDADGISTHSEPIIRSDHHVYKGSAYVQLDAGDWTKAGWARIVVHEDGPNPLFEGAFTLNHDTHHVQMSSTYTRTKHALDPELEQTDHEEMVVYRDSDIYDSPFGPHDHSELKRSESSSACLSNNLMFNNKRTNPVFRNTPRSLESSWAGMSLGSALGRRQVDTVPDNSGGVDLSRTIGDSAGCPSTKKVALVGIATDCGYTASFPPHSPALRKHIINVINQASSVWESTFNISLGLQSLTVLPRECPGKAQPATPWNQDCSSSINMQDRLNFFSAWRGELEDSNAYWTLMTKCTYSGEVGLAWLGQACVNTAQTTEITGGGSETVSGANVVALTPNEWQVLAHETGHTFGAVHDCESQTCQDKAYVNAQDCCPFSKSTCSADSKYIMNPYLEGNQNHFSACTLGNICSAIGRNSVSTSCLSDNNGVKTLTKNVCGNGIVEPGEQCDCGGVEGCAGDQCCDPKTCKFINGAVCDDANDDCCTSCQFSTTARVCRPSTGSCDPEEKCTGKSAMCPRNIIAPNGRACTIKGSPSGAGDLTCASGQCTSRNLQCMAVSSSFTMSGNDTYACDDTTCKLSCGSPSFGANTCESLPQNMVDGTPCGGGGQCRNGQCEGSSFGGEIASWVSEHQSIVIGIAVSVGILLLAIIAFCVCGCVRRRRRQRTFGKLGPRPPSGWYGPPMPPPQGPGPWMNDMGQAPVPQHAGQAADCNTQPGWRPPQPYPHSGLYGGGIIGSRSPWAQQQPAFVPPPATSHYSNLGGNIPRYA